ncbi:MAG TPA: hypothetical protein VLT61_07600 [Anaeromyxobacteraceae bacterium]|nr:hypothetical protein [Anaeromyxobacteraceae bacterium]
MKTNFAVAVLAAVALAACTKETPPPPPPPPAPVAAPAPAPVPAEAPAPAPAPEVKAEPAATAKPSPAPAVKPAPVAPAAKPAEPAAAPAPVLASAHVKVGDAKCRMCHKLQHDSWSASPHAAKGLDCEGCHGGGADFMKVMRDRTAAIAAGLVLPKKDFCKKCHKTDWQDGMYLRVHAHKVK